MSHVIALCGGVGGAKLAFGLARVVPPQDLTIVVNTGDDFEHLGLHISPDIDTVLYTLSGLADRERGWGRAGETWGFMEALRGLGGEDWFQLGDHDLAMHVERTQRLARGETLSEVTAHLARALGVGPSIVPMSDDPVRTVVATASGVLAFQHYFVRERCVPVATGISFTGADAARMSPTFRSVLAREDLSAVIICPSNPYLSVDPILAVSGVRDALARVRAPRIALSPLVGGNAIKGPTAKLMRELGHELRQTSIAAHYRGLIDGLLIDDVDRNELTAVTHSGIACTTSQTVMRSDEDRESVARAMLSFADTIRARAADHAA